MTQSTQEGTEIKDSALIFYPDGVKIPRFLYTFVSKFQNQVQLMKLISVEDAAQWMAMAMAADGVFSDSEKVLLQRFADTYGLDFQELEARTSMLSDESDKEVIQLSRQYLSGYTFEKYIVKSLCMPMSDNSPMFSLVRWRGDKSVDRIFAEDDRNPDLTLRCSLTRSEVEIFVECKYRKAWNSVPSFDKYQLMRYARISRMEKKIVLIACGFGGTPSNPANLAVATIGDFLNRRESIKCIAPDKIDLQKYVFNIVWNKCNHLNLPVNF